MSGKYINESYVDESMFRYPDSRLVWTGFDADQKKSLILWSEMRINQQEYIGTKLSYSDDYQFPRELIESAKTLGILDTEYVDGKAIEAVQAQIYRDDSRIPDSVKRACVQMIVEYIEMIDYKDLQDLNKKAGLS